MLASESRKHAFAPDCTQPFHCFVNRLLTSLQSRIKRSGVDPNPSTSHGDTLELYAERKINAENTLLIFDEVQEVPKALTSLKYFYENAPQYHIICAGFLLGIALHEGTSFPVGKVDFLKLYPLSFKEFLTETGRRQFAELLDQRDYAMITSFKQTYIDALWLM